MATISLVRAEDFEDGDLIDASDYLEQGDNQYVTIDGQPEDVDTWNVIVHTSVGKFAVLRNELLPYGGTKADQEEAS